MSKMLTIIKNKYEEITQSDTGSSVYKMDLHIHTPDSLNDYNFSSKYNKKYEELSFAEIKEYALKNKYLKENEISEFEKHIDKKELTAILILKRAIRKGINLIVIADHNTINGYKTFQYAKKIVKPTIPFDILPGVEITVFGGYHLIGIFDPKKDRYINQWDKVKSRLNWSIDEGKSGVATSKSLLDTIRIVKDVGGITYIPHLDDHDCQGQTWINVLNDNKLDLIGANNINMLPHDKIDSDKLPIINDSDAHSIEEVGSKYKEIKMQYPSFEHLKMSILEKEIRFKEDRKEPESRIIGVAIKGGFLGGTKDSWQLFPFNSDLNCIIGGRGVGKSTLIQYITDLFNTQMSKQKYCFLGQAKYILIYFCIKNEIYCIKGELKPIKNSYTGEWEVELSKQRKKFIDVQDEIILYKINNNKDGIKVDYVQRQKRINILNKLKLESYYQTEIESIGEDPAKVNDWFEKFVISQDSYFNELQFKGKAIKDKLDEKMHKLFNSQKGTLFDMQNETTEIIKEIKMMYKSKKDIKEEQIKIYKALIEKLNSILTGNIKIEVNEKAADKIDLLNYFQTIIQDSKRLNYSQRKILYSHIDYFADLPYPDLIILLIKEEWNEIIEKTDFELIKTSNFQHEAIKWDEETIIKLFKRVFFNNKLYIKPFKAINVKISLDVNSYKINNNPIYRPLSQLSYGQRAIVILDIILEGFTKLGDTSPLIIDQPEDQLDNAYISNYLVKTIREIKGERQIILTTHNANIPIGGDAENVFCLTSNGEHGKIYLNGSIDKSRIISFVVEHM
ncbi:MAG: hypothetical protein ACOCRX_12375, partial [Candidatus Woesearchaeota archaeon]